MPDRPPASEIRAERRRLLLRARARRAMLIERQLLNPRARKAVPQWVVDDALSRFDRAAARYFALALKEVPPNE